MSYMEKQFENEIIIIIIIIALAAGMLAELEMVME